MRPTQTIEEVLEIWLMWALVKGVDARRGTATAREWQRDLLQLYRLSDGLEAE